MGLVRFWIFAGAHDLSDPYMNVFVTKLQIFASHRSGWFDQGAAQGIQWWPHPHPCRLTVQGRLTWCQMIFVNDKMCLIWWYLLMICFSYGDIWKSFLQTTFSQPASLDSPPRGSSPASPCTRVKRVPFKSLDLSESLQWRNAQLTWIWPLENKTLCTHFFCSVAGHSARDERVLASKKSLFPSPQHGWLLS